ncbi:hypothetical protein BELL_0316g00110 [Botrytis elliptica]|uniref:DNA-directed RNA polymerase I subunit RPA34.5 n=1 Tax=Botrytis elliptica TaxID=278938 RepID=A0A4Z1JRY2_9HELO|nr:hypothetical protein BELL_0316g00110 [Botrytis elliptica]
MGPSKVTLSERKKKADSSKSSSKSSAKTATKTPIVKSPQDFKSSEFVGESDNENDEPKGNKSESDSDNDSLPSNPAVKSTSKSKSKSNSKAAESSDSSEAESSEESESESGSDEKESEDESSANAKKSVVPSSSKKDAKTVSMKVAPFKPPPGFEKSSSKNSSKAPQLFSKSNLEGKEIWYITAPASVPIASVTEMSLRDAKLGKAVFSQNGNDYGFVHDPLDDKTYTKILLPSNSKDGYSIEKKSVDQIYHMQQVVNLSKENSSQATVPAKRPVRQQPKGLKARYQPIGFSSAPGIIGSDEDESESEERAPKFQKIAMSEDEASDVEMEDAPPVKKSKSDKSKKSHKDSEESADRSSKKKHKDSGDKKKKHKNSGPEITTNTRASPLHILPSGKASSSPSKDISQSRPAMLGSTVEPLSSHPESTRKKVTATFVVEDSGMPNTKDEPKREKKAQMEAKKRRLESRTDNF